MDAFFASVEQFDNPELRGKAVVVGGDSIRGVVAAASYEARKFGIKSAMSSAIAKRRCPNLIFVKPRFTRYKQASQQIMSIFYEYTDLVEPLSIDEAFLDVSINKKNIKSASIIAIEIKKKIKEKTGLTASAGISINKFLAKIASDYRKPDGLFLIPPEMVVRFVENLMVDKFFGVGKVTAKKMHSVGIFKGRDLKQRSRTELNRLFGKQGDYYYDIARAVDNRPVNPKRIRKSVGTEHTFRKELRNKSEIIKDIIHTAEELESRIKKADFKGRCLTLKIKFSDFKQITRSKTQTKIIDNKDLRFFLKSSG
jgi:DNA polymerase-4